MASEIKVTNIKANDGTSSLTVANSTGKISLSAGVSSSLSVDGAITASGGIADAGTITAGTLGDSVVVPATTGGWKLLNRTAISGSPTYVEFINGTGGVVIDSSTYERYKFILSGIGCTTDICNVSINAGISSGYITASNYRVAGQENASGGTHNNRHSNSFNHLPLGWVGTSNGGDERPFLSTLEMDLKANHFPVFRFNSAQFQDTNYFSLSIGGGVIIGADYHGDHIDRVRFFYHQHYTSSSSSSAQTWENTGSIALYGLKTS